MGAGAVGPDAGFHHKLLESPAVAYHYRPAVMEALAGHGVRPTSETRPDLMHEFVSDLYRFELRRLRERQVRGDIPKAQYAQHVVALRKRYLLVSLPLQHWTTDVSATR